MTRFSRESRRWLKSKTMNKKYHSNRYRRPLVAAVFFTTVIALFASCKKDQEELGIGLQPADQLLQLYQTDTLTLIASTITEDSLRTDELSLSLIGNYLDPEMGRTRTSINTQLRLSTSEQDYGANPVVDSIVFTMAYTGTFYGSLGSQLYSVTEITEDLYLDSSYYSNRSFERSSTELVALGKGYKKFDFSGFVTLANGDSLPPHLRLRLSDEFGEYLMNLGTDAYSSNENFLASFKGLHVESLSDDGGVTPLNLLSGNSRVRLYYHNDSDTTSFDFSINNQSARTGEFAHDFMGPVMLLGDGEDVDGSLTGYVQAGSSAKVKINLPTIMDLNEFDEFDGRTVNRAELVVPVQEGYDGRYDRPSLLFLLTEGEDGNLVGLPDQLSSSVNIGGLYNNDRDAYVFNISRYVQNLLNGEQAASTLYLVSNNASVSVNRVLINGPEVLSDDKMRLILTFSN